MPTIPKAILKQIYRRGSLRNTAAGYAFTMRQDLATANIVGLRLLIDGVEVPASSIAIEQNGESTPVEALSVASPLRFPKAVDTIVSVAGVSLPAGKHSLAITAETKEIGPVVIEVADECG